MNLKTDYNAHTPLLQSGIPSIPPISVAIFRLVSCVNRLLRCLGGCRGGGVEQFRVAEASVV